MNVLEIIAAVLVAIIGSARLVRVLTIDDFPPSVWIRIHWAALTKDGPWAKLVACLWCAAPWIMLGCLAWFALGLLVVWIAWAWWLFFGWLALSYLTSIFVRHDEPDDE